MATTTMPPAGDGVKGLLVRKRFGVPTWVILLVMLAILVLVLMWRRNRSKTATEAATSQDTTTTDQGAPPIFIVPQAPVPVVQVPVTVNPPPGPPTGTVPPAPPGGGRPNPPGTPPPTTPGPKPPGKMETVVKWTATNTPWNSTISGMVSHYHMKLSWQQVWNDPLNADLRNKRGAADRIQAGDKVFLRGVS